MLVFGRVISYLLGANIDAQTYNEQSFNHDIALSIILWWWIEQASHLVLALDVPHRHNTDRCLVYIFFSIYPESRSFYISWRRKMQAGDDLYVLLNLEPSTAFPPFPVVHYLWLYIKKPGLNRFSQNKLKQNFTISREMVMLFLMIETTVTVAIHRFTHDGYKLYLRLFQHTFGTHP